MVQLPRGVPFIDLLVPSADKEAVEALQTRFELAGGGGWRIMADDGTMEASSVPMGPLRGDSDRVWAYRTRPWMPGEPLQEGVSLAMELAISLQARVAAFGVHGTYAWGLVLAEDVRWLHGLVLLDWLYNPRLSEDGQILEAQEGADEAQLRLGRKLSVFKRLWTVERSMAFASSLPPGAVQQVEGLLALPLLGPAGDFDPRYWQGFALQLAVAEVQSFAAAAGDAAASPSSPSAASPPSPSSPSASAPASGFQAMQASTPSTPAPSQPRPSAPRPKQSAAAPLPDLALPNEDDDGLTPLARAMRRAEDRAAGGEEEPPAVEAPRELEGSATRWVPTDSGDVWVVPMDRYDASLIRAVRRGSTSELHPSERPAGERFETWLEAGAPFITEVPLFSRLFRENRPLHRSAFIDDGTEDDGTHRLRCQLPRVAPVLAVLIPAAGEGKRRILVSSKPDLSSATLRAALG